MEGIQGTRFLFMGGGGGGGGWAFFTPAHKTKCMFYFSCIKWQCCYRFNKCSFENLHGLYLAKCYSIACCIISISRNIQVQNVLIYK